MNRKIFFSIATLLLAISLQAAPPVDEGKAIFAARCAACHNINKYLTGPALSGVDQRRSIDWIVRFVHSPQSVIASGDKEATALYAKFNNITMPDHADLSEAQIKNVVAYVRSESKPGGNTEKAPFAKPAKLRPNYLPVSVTNPGFFVAYGALVLLLIAVLAFAVQVKEFERHRQLP